MTQEIDWGNPKRRQPPPISCAVCGLRSEALICAACLATRAASIAWLEKLPARLAREQQALEQLSRPALTFSGAALDYWRDEVARGCAVSLARLRGIVESRGADVDRTIAGLKGV